MQNIGKRISVSEKDGSSSIIILSQKDKVKQRIMLVWLIFWSLGGIIVLSQIFTDLNREQKIFLVVWIGFWAYFEFIVGHAFLWRKIGFERILIKGEKLFYRREIDGKGKLYTYDIEWIRNLKLVDNSSSNSFLLDLRKSYWVIAGESISFDYKGRSIKIALQVDGEEAQKLLQLIQKRINK